MNNVNAYRLAPILWILLVIFILRVIGQILVVLNLGDFLPPMEEWQSGILSYPYLLISQIAIIIFYGKICLDFSKGKGFFSMPHKKLGKGFLIFGAIYLVAMLLRYILYMILHPGARWFGGTIPIFVHCVLATFLILVGNFHRRYWE
jgi:hypothetical protein